MSGCLGVPHMAQELLLRDECLDRLHGEHYWADSPKLHGWGYLTYLFPSNLSSYFLGELQQCLKDPDWLAQLFIKHVRLERVELGVGLGGRWDSADGFSLLTHPALS